MELSQEERPREALALLCWALILGQALAGACGHSGVGAAPVPLDRSFVHRDSLRCGRPGGTPWLVGADSVGPISLTATFEAIRRLCPGTRDSVDTFLNESAFLILPMFDGKVWIEPPPAPDYSSASLRASLWAVDCRDTRGANTRRPRSAEHAPVSSRTARSDAGDTVAGRGHLRCSAS